MTKLFQGLELAVKNFLVDLDLVFAPWRLCGKRNWYDARKIPLLPLWLVTGKFSRRKDKTKLFVAPTVAALEDKL
jgi:hypothetical protein